jgi:hypothetical protein
MSNPIVNRPEKGKNKKYKENQSLSEKWRGAVLEGREHENSLKINALWR